jgi:hypothetical protein
MMGQSRERMRSEHRRQEMADSDSSPSHPGSLVVPSRDWRQIGGWGEGHGLGLHVVLICPISTRETAAAYTGLLGCDLNSKFFLYKLIWNQRLKQKKVT